MVVIEDNPADVFLIRYALRMRGIDQVTVLEEGEAGYNFVTRIERGLAAPPDLFILDLSLPRRTGPELLELIKSSRACSSARIIIASSSRSPTDRAIVSRLGADRYFVKPSSFDEFIAIGALVSELLDRREPRP